LGAADLMVGDTMRSRALFMLAAVVGHLAAHMPAFAQVQAVPPVAGAGPVIVPPVAPPVSTVLPPVTGAPVVNPTVVVSPPPPAHTEASPDGGDSDCRCPNGQTADVDGWCWRPTEAASGYWQKAEKCQN
jgi:hypothetical protein